MALVRCKHHGKPKGRSVNYVRNVKPVGWPETAAVCGRSGCEQPGLIWLSEEESRSYHEGQRVFEFNNASMKVRAAQHPGEQAVSEALIRQIRTQ